MKSTNKISVSKLGETIFVQVGAVEIQGIISDCEFDPTYFSNAESESYYDKHWEIIEKKVAEYLQM